METIDLFRMATARTVCGLTDCVTCHNIYNGLKECPVDKSGDYRTEILNLVNKIDSILRHYQSSRVFDWEPTDEELADIIMEAVDSEH